MVNSGSIPLYTTKINNMKEIKDLKGTHLQARLLFLAMEMTNNLTLSEMLMNNKRWCELQGVKKEGDRWVQIQELQNKNE